jgi:TatD DNase family protein
MSPEIIDTHAHLDMSQFDHDRDEVISRAQNAGVKYILTVGIDLLSSQRAIELAESNSGIIAAIGFHPQEANLMKSDSIRNLREMAKNTQVVAIGEIGLDYYRVKSPADVQIKVIRSLLNLAAEMNLPVIIHCRQAEQDMLKILTEWTASLVKELKQNPGVIHCFSGDAVSAEKYLNLGFNIAFGAYIGYPSSRLSETIRFVPDDKLLIETDCPFLPPQTYRGKRNEPSYLPDTLGVIAGIKAKSLKSFENLAKQTSNNARRLFRIR